LPAGLAVNSASSCSCDIVSSLSTSYAMSPSPAASGLGCSARQ